MKKQPAFHRTELLIGEAALKKLAATRVILFGVGGVGSWCAEALIRSKNPEKPNRRPLREQQPCR